MNAHLLVIAPDPFVRRLLAECVVACPGPAPVAETDGEEVPEAHCAVAAIELDPAAAADTSSPLHEDIRSCPVDTPLILLLDCRADIRGVLLASRVLRARLGDRVSATVAITRARVRDEDRVRLRSSGLDEVLGAADVCARRLQEAVVSAIALCAEDYEFVEEPEPTPDSPQTSVDGTAETSAPGSTESPTPPEHPAEVALAGDRARAVDANAAQLDWFGLYDDHGLAVSQTAAAADAAGKPAAHSGDAGGIARSATIDDIVAVCGRQEAEAAIVEFGQAKPLKANVQMALKLARDANATVDDLARALKQDQALAARVLQVANSPIYRRGRPLSSVEQAIVRVGVNEIRETISTLAALDQFSEAVGDEINLSLLWEHGFATGMIAAELAAATSACPRDDAFTFGLMHDLGRVAMLSQFGDDYLNALRTAKAANLPAERVEKRMFEINHADAAGVLFRTWGFDVGICAPVSDHHLSKANIHHLDPAGENRTTLLQTANTIAHAALLGDSGSDWIRPIELVIGGRRIPSPIIRSACERARRTAEDLRVLMAQFSGGKPPEDAATILREYLEAPFRPLVITPDDEFDVLQLLAARLADPSDDAPNLAVVRLEAEDASGAQALGRLKNSEDTLGVDPLPAICFHENSDAGAPAAFADRPHFSFAGAFRTSWVIRAINELLAGAVSEDDEQDTEAEAGADDA